MNIDKNVKMLWDSLGKTPNANHFIELVRGLRDTEDPETRICVLAKGFIHKNIENTNPISLRTIVGFIESTLGFIIDERLYGDIESLLFNMDIKKRIPFDETNMLYDYHIKYKPISEEDEIQNEHKSTKKIFIAYAMDGVPDKDIESIRDKIQACLKSKFPNDNIEIVDQFHIPEEDMPKPGMKNPRIDMLGRSIRFLADVDLVVFYGDFAKSKGCSVELTVCKEYDIPYITMNESDITKAGFKLEFSNYLVFMSDMIPDGCIYVSDCYDHSEDVVVTRFPHTKFINLKTHPESYMPDEYSIQYPEYAVVNYKTALELGIELDGLGDIISIAKQRPRSYKVKRSK